VRRECTAAYSAISKPGTFGSDEPPFEKGILATMKKLHHGPLSDIMSLPERFKLVSALALGIGLAIELLPPPLRDHMPDRYIGAT